MDENNNGSISKKELFRNLSAVRFQPRMTELAANHGYLNRWFSKLLLGNYRPAKRKDQVDKAEEKLMKILHKYDVGTNKLNLVDLTCMWHDVLHRVYVKVTTLTQEKINLISSLMVVMVTVVLNSSTETETETET